MNNPSSDTVLSCTNISRSYKQGDHVLTVLKDLNLYVKPGEKVAITGASGSGKTTLLNLLGGLDKPDTGDVSIRGQSLNDLAGLDLDRIRNHELGFVYQFHHLLGEFSALENVAMPLIIAKMQFNQALKKAEELLTKVGLGERLEHKPSELSGGERQRVAIARALVNEPSCVLMDEPTGNLDRGTAAEIQNLLLALNEQMDTSIVLVTHDPQLARRMDRVLSLSNGRLEEQES